jgi:hypothetical protein
VDVTSNRHRIARWLRGLAGELGEEAAPSFILRHVSINDRHVDVATFAKQKLSLEETALGELVKRIGDAADTDADGLGGVQRYIVVAIVDDHQVGRLPMRCAQGVDGAIEPIESEPATSKGLLGQLMRHNEAQTRLFTVSMGQIFGTMQRTISRLEDRAEIGEERRLEAVQITEKLLSEEQTRDLEAQKAAFNQELKYEAFQKFMGVLPQILGFLGGKDGPSHFLGLLQRLLGSLKPEQFDGLARLFSPDQMELVNQLMTMSPPEQTSAATPEDAAAPSPGDQS